MKYDIKRTHMQHIKEMYNMHTQYSLPFISSLRSMIRFLFCMITEISQAVFTDLLCELKTLNLCIS